MLQQIPRNQLIIHNFDFSVEDQPLEVIKRVKALKKLQFENIKHEVSNEWGPITFQIDLRCVTTRSVTSWT